MAADAGRCEVSRRHGQGNPRRVSVTAHAVEIGSRRRPQRVARYTGAPGFALVSVWSGLSLILALLIFIVYMSFVPGLPTDGGWTFDNWKQLGSTSFLTQIL